jgi:Protein phosphatase 2C
MSRSKWRIAGASVEGTSHTERGDACQDYHRFRSVASENDDVVIATAADGAGSASNGLDGAKMVCDSFVKNVASYFSRGGRIDQLNDDFITRWVADIQSRIARAAKTGGKEARDYSCTFLGAVVSSGDAVFFQIGDGAIVYSTIDAPGAYRFPIVPAESMYVNTTDFITDAAAAQKIKIQFLPEAVGNFALFTDGIQALAIDYSDGGKGKPHTPFWTPMFAPFARKVDTADLAKKLEMFLASETVNRRTDDDKTLILISRNTADKNILTR